VNATLERLSRVYAWMTALYPYEYRRVFSYEMQSVFRDRLADSLDRGRWGLWGVVYSELRDWPAAVFQAYWSAIGAMLWRSIMSLLFEDKHWRIQERRQALVASLPPVLLGCGITLGALVIRNPWYADPRWRLYAGVLVTLVPGGVVALGGTWATLKRFPSWGYSWIGTAAMGCLMFVKTMVEERADEGLPMISPVADTLIAGVVVLGIAVLLGLAAWRGWRHAGLLSLGFTIAISLGTLQAVTAAPFNRYDIALSAAPLGLVMSLLLYLYVRKGDAGRLAAMAGYCLLNTAMLLVARSIWQPWLSERGLPSPVVPLFVLLTGAVLVGPVAGLVGRPLRRVIRGS